MAESPVILPRHPGEWRRVFNRHLVRAITHTFQEHIVVRHRHNVCPFLSRQEDGQLAAGPLSCSNQLHLPVLPAHYMGRAQADGKEAAGQPPTCSGSLQLGHGLPVCLHVL